MSVPCSKQPTASNTLLSELGAPSVVHAAPLQAQPPPPLPKTAPSPSQVFDATTSDPFAPNATKGGGAVDSFADFSTANFDTPTPGKNLDLNLILSKVIK